MATVDIIIPTFNRTKILSETLESVKNQTYEDWHCWIAEDGENSEYKKVLEPFLADKRFTHIPGIHTGSPATSRNRAMLQGNAPYIAFLDDDDYWLPEKLEKQLNFMEAHQNCVILGSQCYRRQNDDDTISELALYYKVFELESISYKSLAERNPLMNSTVIIHRKVLDKAGLQNDKINPPNALDYDHWLRIGVLGEIWRMPDPLIIYRDIPSESIRSIPDKRTYYLIIMNVLKSALSGTGTVPSPLSLEENKEYAQICKNRLVELKTLYKAHSPSKQFQTKIVNKFKAIFNSLH